jgi:hypothetical protein
MPTIARTHASLRFWGDDLDPDDLTAQLGAQPDLWARKGEAIRSKRRGPKTIAKTGKWSFGVQPRVPGDLDGQIRELFGMLTSDLSVWRELSAKYENDLFVGLFMEVFNEGFEVSCECLAMLGERGVKLGLDIYGSEKDPDGLLKGTIAVIEASRSSTADRRSARGAIGVPGCLKVGAPSAPRTGSRPTCT